MPVVTRATPASPPTLVAKRYQSMPAAQLPLPEASPAATLAEYQREFAGRLHAANAGMVFDGPPPNPVRAVIVMRAEIDALGDARRLDLYRAPHHSPWLEELVRQTLRQAAPFPRPSETLMNGTRSVVFTESWLFDYQGRFRLRTLSAPQQEVEADEEEGAR